MGAERVKGEGSSSDGAKKLIRCIIGPGRHEVQTFACAVKITMYLLFHEKTAQDDIVVTRDIYSRVAEQLGKGERTVSRQIQRMGNLCWEHLGTEGQKTYTGREMKDIHAPSDMLFYLAYYSYFGKPYYEVLEKQPGLLFGKIEEEIS